MVVTFSLLAAVVVAPTLFATIFVLLATPFVVGTLGDLLLGVVLVTVESGFRVGVIFDVVVDDTLNVVDFAAGLLAAVVVDVFVGDNFETVDFIALGLSEVNDVFGLVNVVERAVDVSGADLTRDVVDDTVDVVVFVAVTFDGALVAGLEIGLEVSGTRGLNKLVFGTVVVRVAVVVALDVRAVAGFVAKPDVRVAPTADFVTALADAVVVVVVVVFFVIVDVTPEPLLSGLRVVDDNVGFFSTVVVPPTFGATVRDATFGAAVVFGALMVLDFKSVVFEASGFLAVTLLAGATLLLTSVFFASVDVLALIEVALATPTAAAATAVVAATAAAAATIGSLTLLSAIICCSV